MNTKKLYPRQSVNGVAGLVILSAILISTWTSGCNQNLEQTIAFTHVNLIPMTSETVIENQTVLVSGSDIIDIGPADELKIPRGSQVIDGKGAYLMPGLADMHAHTRISTGQWAQPWEDPNIWPVHPLNLYLANGVTTIRDLSAMDETGTYPLQLRDEIREGKRVGPTIYTAGESLYASPLGDPEGLVRQNHERGFDLLKVYPYLSAADFQAAMREAKKLGTYITGHIPYAVGLEGVLAEGMDEIAHVEELVWEFFEFDRGSQLSTQEWGAYLFQAVLQNIDLNSSNPLAEFEKENQSTLENLAVQLRTAGVAVCTTIDVAETTRMKLFQPDAFLARPENKFLDPKYLDAFRRGEEYQQVSSQGWENVFTLEYDFATWILGGLHEAGVQLLLGTDALGGLGIVPGYSIHDELRILVENGFTPYEALLTGTVNAASVVEKMTGEGDFGTIEIGKRADLILVKGNPLEDITTIKEPLGVMASGRWFSGEELSQLIEANSMQQSCQTEDACDKVIFSGCTVFSVSKGDQVFFGGNDDYINPDSYYWVDPGNAGNYGAIWIGTRDNVQQGVNEKGLAYDANGLPRLDVNPHREREPVPGGYSNYPIRILHECATVEEVIDWVNTHQWHSYMHDQMHFADATGDALIISAGADGEVVFTRKPSGNDFLVSTNFNVANPSNNYGYPCSRYKTATEKLEQLVGQEGELTVQDAVNVLDAVHVEGNASWTIESMVADLPHGIVYLYYFHQYDKPVVLNVMEEITNVRADGPLSRLFPEEVRQEAARRYQRIQEGKNFNGMLGKVWLGLVIISLAILLIGSIKSKKGLIFWVPVVVILGPVGLVIWLTAGRTGRTGKWRPILVEAVGDVLPTVVAFLAATVMLVLNMGASELVTLLLYIASPLVIGLVFFQGPLLAFVTQNGYLRTLLLRLPHTWVTANLGIAVLFPIALPLAIRSIQLPLDIWTVIFWWGLIALCGLAAILFLLPYEAWGAHHNYRAWSILAWREGDVNSARWKKLWWWILLSYVAIIGGIVCYTFIQQIIQW